MEVIDKTNALDSSSSTLSGQYVVQIYLLKNRLSYQDPTTYAAVQNMVIKDSFYSVLGDKLKDYPQVLKKTPLISLQFFSQGLEKPTKIYNIKDNVKVQLTELKISREGYLYCMILPTNSDMKNRIIGLHVKYGIDALNTAATWRRKFTVDDPNWIIYFNIEDLPHKTDYTESNYTFYYYATDKRVEELAGSTSVKTIDFSIKLIKPASPSSIISISSFVILLTLFVIAF